MASLAPDVVVVVVVGIVAAAVGQLWVNARVYCTSTFDFSFILFISVTFCMCQKFLALDKLKTKVSQMKIKLAKK